jgi:hypothetical protein
MSELGTDFYDLGYQAGAVDVSPGPVPDGNGSKANRKDYLAGWVLGQAILSRAIRMGWMTISDPPKESDEERREAEVRGSGG